MKKHKRIVGILFLIFVFCIAGINVYVSFKRNIKESREYGNNTKKTDQIYNDAMETKDVIELKHITGEYDDTVGYAIPEIQEYIKTNNVIALYEHLDQKVMEEYHWICEKEQFDMKIEEMREKIGTDHFILQPYRIMDMSSYYICYVSVIPCKDGKSKEVLYDYEKAFEIEVTLMLNDDSFTWLPFNIKKPAAALEYFGYK